MDDKGILKGRLNFEGKSDVSTFVVCAVNKVSKAMSKDAVPKDDAVGHKVCRALFSGSEPKPPVGWWKRHHTPQDPAGIWRPKAIISVTGGADFFRLSEKDEEHERRMEKLSSGILKAAHAFKAMIVTGGSNKGVMKLIGDAVESDGDHIATLGIFPYGAMFKVHPEGAMVGRVGNGAKLDSEGANVVNGAKLDSEGAKAGRVVSGPKLHSERFVGDHKMRMNGGHLDGNHHFFALIDDGERGTAAWGTEIPSRHAIESVLIEMPESTVGASKPSVKPHVLLIVNGGPGTIDTALEVSQMAKHAAQEKIEKVVQVVVVEGTGGTGTIDTALEVSQMAKHSAQGKIEKVVPIVVVEGTGRAADIIAHTWTLNRQRASLNQEAISKLERERMDRCLELAKGKQKDAEDYIKKAEQICEEDVVTVYKFSDAHSLGYSMMKSICRGTMLKLPGKKCAKLSTSEQLKLVLAWNDVEGELIDMAKNEILPHHVGSKTDFTKLLISGLRRNKVQFVEMLIDFDVPLPSKDDMAELYSTKSHESTIIDSKSIRSNESTKWQSVQAVLCVRSPHEGPPKVDPKSGAGHSSRQTTTAQPEQQADSGQVSAAAANAKLGGLLAQQATPPRTPKSEAIHEDILNRIIRISNKDAFRMAAAQQSPELGGSGGDGGQPEMQPPPTDKHQCDPKKVLNMLMGWRLFNPFESVDQWTTREHLFLWSILTGRTEMAEMFWRKCHQDLRQHCISRALFACAIAKTLGPYMLPRHSRLFVAESGAAAGSQDMASRFERIARDLLDECYTKSPQDAVMALTYPLLHPSQCTWIDQPFKGHINEVSDEKFLTPIMLAFDAEAELFVEHPAFQECLDRIWYGRLVTRREELRMAGSNNTCGFRLQPKGVLSMLFHDTLEDSRGLLASWDILILALLGFPAMLCRDSASIRNQRIGDSSAGVRQDNPKLIIVHRLLAFYSAPVVKFYLDFSSYLCFLLIYTYVGLNMDFEYTLLEGVMHAWIVSLALIEVRDLHKSGKRYMQSISNAFDFIIILFYVPAAVLRIYERVTYNSASFQALGGGNRTDPSNLGGQLLLPNHAAVYSVSGEDFMKARSWHGMAGILFWIRITDFFRVSQKLGPLMFVLLRVFWDAFQFFVILLIFIISFGAAILCAGRPRRDENISMAAYVNQMVFLPYLMIFGEHFLDGFPLSIDNYMLCDNQSDSCTTNGKLGIILLCLYLFVSTILLLNLLIAMMNSTYSAVLSKSTTHWKFQRLEFVLSYSFKSILPMPFSVVAWILSELFSFIAKVWIGSRASENGKVGLPYIHVRKDRLRQLYALELELKLWQEGKDAEDEKDEKIKKELEDKKEKDNEPPSSQSPRETNHDSIIIDENYSFPSNKTVLEFTKLTSVIEKKRKKEMEKKSTVDQEKKSTVDQVKRSTVDPEQDKLKNALLGDLKKMDTAIEHFQKSLMKEPPSGDREEMDRAIRDFKAGNTVGEILYKNSHMMSSFYSDVYLEDWWLQPRFQHYEPQEPKMQGCTNTLGNEPVVGESKRADAMQKFTNLFANVPVEPKDVGESLRAKAMQRCTNVLANVGMKWISQHSNSSSSN